jgi:gluconolactonase
MPWKFELLMKPVGDTTEGPVWDGEHLYFTHNRANRILRYDPKSGAITQAYSDTRRTNGMAFDAEGRLFGCCAAGRSIVRFDPKTGKRITIVDQFEGKRLNTPNDLAVDRKGRIWFTNPWNEGMQDPGDRPDMEDSVMRADPQKDGSYTLTRVTFDTTKPNGILVSQDQKTLYVAESNNEKGGARELRAYPIRDDGSLGSYTNLHTWGEDSRGAHRAIDGMCLDAEGNIIACAGWEVSGPGPMIYVFSPGGRVLETHPTPVLRPTNCCFGGPDMTTFFLTSSNKEGHLYMARTDRVGWAIYP